MYALEVGDGAFFLGVGEDGDEFVTPVTRDQVHRAVLRVEDARETSKNFVPDDVPQGVVVVLEVVHVEEHHAERTAPSGRRYLTLEMNLEVTPVRQARQGVRHREGLQILMELSVVECDRGLAGEVRENTHVLIAECPYARTGHQQRTRHFVIDDEGHRDPRSALEHVTEDPGHERPLSDVLDNEGGLLARELVVDRSLGVPGRADWNRDGPVRRAAGGHAVLHHPHGGPVGVQRVQDRGGHLPQHLVEVQRAGERPSDLLDLLRLPSSAIQLVDVAGVLHGDRCQVGDPLQ